MNRIALVLLIGALLVIILASVLIERPLPAHRLMDEWERIAEDSRNGKLTCEESIRRADALLKRSKEIWRKERGSKKCSFQ